MRGPLCFPQSASFHTPGFSISLSSSSSLSQQPVSLLPPHVDCIFWPCVCVLPKFVSLIFSAIIGRLNYLLFRCFMCSWWLSFFPFSKFLFCFCFVSSRVLNYFNLNIEVSPKNLSMMFYLRIVIVIFPGMILEGRGILSWARFLLLFKVERVGYLVSSMTKPLCVKQLAMSMFSRKRKGRRIQLMKITLNRLISYAEKSFLVFIPF